MTRAVLQLGLFFSLLLDAACGGLNVPTPIDDGGSSDSSAAEGGSDAGADSSFDAGVDSGFDAGEDSGSKAGVDSGFDAGEDSGSDAGVDSGSVIPAVRPISPLATTTVTSQTPTFHWELPAGADGATVLLCRDRALSTSCTTFSATGSSARPPSALSPGVWFWQLTGRSGSLEGTAIGPTWEFFVGHGSAPVDTSWGATLDVNGDGYADVVVGAWGSNTAYFYLGSAAGVASVPVTLTGPSGSSHFGAAVASAGDVNGDGYADVVVGAWGSNTAYVYLASAAGLASSSVTTLTGPSGSSLFGGTVASAGDVNGDGYADVVVGADGSNAAYVYLGSATGVAAAPVTLTGPSGSYFGIAVASAGDVNGDGYADVVVGADGSNTADVYPGSATGVASASVVTLTGPSGSSFGLSVASAGDVNGDGYADVVVGADGSNTAYVYPGSATGVASASVIALTGPSSSAFGGSVASAGDVNGDGCADVVVGADSSSTAYVYLGSGSAASDLARLVELTGPSGTSFGYSVASAGDVNGDGYADVVVGADNSNAYLYPGSGSAAGVASASVTTLTGPSGSLDFGLSVASAGDVSDTVHPSGGGLANWVLL